MRQLKIEFIVMNEATIIYDQRQMIGLRQSTVDPEQDSRGTFVTLQR